MSAHDFGDAEVNPGGSGRTVVCSCGLRLSATTVDDLGNAMTSHLVAEGVEPTCRKCGGELVDWSSTVDYVPAEDGVCGRCRRDSMSPMELGRRRAAL